MLDREHQFHFTDGKAEAQMACLGCTEHKIVHFGKDFLLWESRAADQKGKPVSFPDGK